MLVIMRKVRVWTPKPPCIYVALYIYKYSNLHVHSKKERKNLTEIAIHTSPSPNAVKIQVNECPSFASLSTKRKEKEDKWRRKRPDFEKLGDSAMRALKMESWRNLNLSSSFFDHRYTLFWFHCVVFLVSTSEVMIDLIIHVEELHILTVMITLKRRARYAYRNSSMCRFG